MMMRTVSMTILAAFLAVSLAACNAANAKAPAGSQASPVEAARDQAAPASDGSTEPSASEPVADEPTNDYVAESAFSYADEDVDVDLMQMSGTAVYSAVYQMMVEPQSYQDQVVRMKGIFYSQYDEAMDKRYYFVIVQDATACCAQGIEFVWDDGGHEYPGDYPAEGAEVVVCGKFGTYAERSSQFAYLSKASLQLA